MRKSVDFFHRGELLFFREIVVKTNNKGVVYHDPGGKNICALILLNHTVLLPIP